MTKIDNVGAEMKVTILTVALSLPWAGYVGVYAEHEHCREMQALIAAEQPQAVIVCRDVAVREPVLIPPPRPDNLRRPVPVPPMRPLR